MALRLPENWNLKKAITWSLAVLLTSSLVAAVFAATYYGVVTQRIDERMEQLKSTRASQFYALYPPFKPKQRFLLPELQSLLGDQGYVERNTAEDLRVGEYRIDRSKKPLELTLHRGAFDGAGHSFETVRAKLTFEEVARELTLTSLVRADDNQPLEQFEGVPKKIGSYFAGRLRTQSAVGLSDIPASMRLAVMAIEDIHFLDHAGVSLRSTLRALWQDLKARKWVEGGSTLTQQLMKNLFFSREKSLTRKFKEAFYALVAESRYSKETILEAYLNEVYLGQWGTREIHGVAEGAGVFFNRPVTQLTVSQSATLAAIIQAPNAQDPHKFPERTMKRRNLVLKRMKDADFITAEEFDVASREPLGVVPAERSLQNVDYFLDLVMERLPSDLKPRLDQEALTVYTTLNPYLQAVASKAMNANLERIRKLSATVRKKEAKGFHLESALVAIDPRDCTVLALQGGHSYRASQFNRILQGKRQPGSLFKPFVFLTAFRLATKDAPFTPVTELEDAPFEWSYEGQVWKPKNYEEDFLGKVTARQVLEHSINTPTARLAQLVGVPAIMDTLQKAGIRSTMKAIPSISLGSTEATPMELADAYTTLANLGKACESRPYVQIFNENKILLVDNQLQQHEALPAAPTYQTVNIMKGVFTHGTARAAQASGIALNTFAGKTGTTNEARDAWFGGFSPELLTLTWVGFDEEEKVGLTGAAAALPLWTEFVRGARPFLPGEDFKKPEGIEPFDICRNCRGIATPKCPEIEVDYFIPGTEPKESCPAT